MRANEGQNASLDAYLPKNALAIVFYSICAIAFFYIASWAWVSDDAYITFRVVDNAVNGFGLRWNIDERVQAYTHPLWMLLHIPFYAIWRNIFLVTIGLSMACGVTATAMLIKSIPASYVHKIVLVLLPLALSKAFRNHIIDGLESPLTLFLLAWFWHDFIRTPHKTCRLLFIASLTLLSRLDNAIMLLPPLVWIVAHFRRPFFILRHLAAIAPLGAWFTFSLFYYGFLFPNTKYAKLNTGLSAQAYITQGYYYSY